MRQPASTNLAASAVPLAGLSRFSGSRLAVLLALIAIEVALFWVFGTNFGTRENFFEVARISTELGLLALALTPVIVTGGIDLSVGSLMGLCAVMLGKLWRDAGLPPYVAAAATVVIGGLAGLLNGLLITRLRIPPLIVTLGSYSLFRGLAEGITGGMDNFTSFPASFLFLGQGYLGPVPAQLPILLLAAIGFYLLLHRSAIGRAWSAIGFSPEGARHAAIPVERRILLAYLLSSLAAAVAAVIYVARFGQAKAEAATGYELSAITAVVLGGTSIFGGRGTIVGSLLGLFAIAILQNGLLLADLPSELAGILSGALLLGATALEGRPLLRYLWKLFGQYPSPTMATVAGDAEEFSMRNSQLAALCAVILLAAAIVTGGNYLLVRELRVTAARGSGENGAATIARTTDGTGAEPSSPAKQLTIAMMPKSKGNGYFRVCQKGAEQAARELGINLLWDGPTNPDPARQNEIVETWITRGVDAIIVACENGKGLSTALRKARQRGIKVITYDADAEPDARDFFVNQATPQAIGTALMDEAARIMGGKGEFAIITGSLTSDNMNEWRKYVEARRVEKYPGCRMVAIRPCDDQQDKALEEAKTILATQPNLKLFMAITSLGVPGAAEAVKQKDRREVKVIGLGLPNENKLYVHDGVTETVILWNVSDLGYLAVHAGVAAKNGTLKAGGPRFKAGHLGAVEVQGDNVLLGPPLKFTKDNIDQYDF